MPVVDGREYRTFQMSAVEPEEGAEPSYMVEGYATTFDDPYKFGPDGAYERIDAGALESADMSDVIFQYDHRGAVMARLRNGSMELTCDPHGLFVRAYLGGCQQGRDLYEAIRSGLVDRMSWGFSVPDDGWEWDRDTRTSTITRVAKVYDVSAVSIPANEGTEIHARSYLDGVIERERGEYALREREMKERSALAALIETL